MKKLFFMRSGDNMKILIKNRLEIETLAQNPFEQCTALISITDYDYDFAELKNKPQYLLQLAFDDVDNDVFEDEADLPRHLIEEKYHMFTDVQAEKIAHFYKKIKGKAEVVICQCEHGQSRSAAVAAAITECENKNGIEIFADDKYFPNKVVFRKVYAHLSEG